MRILDRYVLREFLGPFLAAITAFIVISLSVQLFWLAEMVVVKNTPLSTVLRLILFNLPSAIVQVLPFATLFAVLLGLGRLSKDSELSIMRAAGLRLSRIAAPMIAIALVISGLGFYLGDRVAPTANLEARNIVNRMILGDSIPNIENNVFFRGPDNKFFYIGRVSEDRATVQDIMIYDIGYGRYPQLITAASGKADTGTWVFTNGNIHECGADGRVVSTAHFDTMTIIMERAVTEYTNSGRTTSEMSMKELKQSIELFSKSGIKAKNLLIDYYLKIAQPLSSLIFAVLAIPLAVRSPRRGGAVYSIAAGIVIVTLYFIFESVVRSYGMLQATQIKPWMAAWSADMLFMIAAVLLLMRADAKRMRRKVRIIPPRGPASSALMIILLVLAFAPVAAAQETNVRVTAQRLVYEGTDIWSAKGDVEVSFDDVIIKADEARIDLAAAKAYLSGNVSVRTGDSFIESVSATMDIKTRKVEFATLEGQLSDERVNGYIYIAGEKFSEEDGSFKLSGGYITTCELPQPHYRIEASSIELTGSDFIIAKDVSYFEGNIRLIRLPSLTIPLREEDRLILPEFGWSAQDGVYVKTTMRRRLDEDNLLTLRLDFFTVSGLGAGMRHDYAFAGIGDGYYSIYVLKSLTRPQTGMTAELYQELELPLDFKASGKYSYKYSLGSTLKVTEEHFAELKLSRAVTGHKTSLSASYRYKDADSDTAALAVSASHSSELPEGVRLSGSASYRRNETEGVLSSESLTYKASVSHQSDYTRLTLNFQASETMKEDQVTVSSSLRRLPELTLELLKTKIGSLPLSISGDISAGRYLERILDTDPVEYLDAGKAEAGISLTLDRQELWGFLSFDLGATVRGSVYTEGSRRLYGSIGTGLTVTPVKGWSVKLAYDWADLTGESPYRFDALAGKNKITASTTATFYGFTATAGTGYDFLKAKYDAFAAGLSYNYQGKYFASVSARFALPAFTLTSITGRLTLKPTDDIELKLGMEYNGTTGKVGKVETSGDVRLIEGWRAVWALIYDVGKEGLMKADIAVTRDLHCREITAGYQFVENRFFVNLKFKAFPDVPIGIGDGDWSIIGN